MSGALAVCFGVAIGLAFARILVSPAPGPGRHPLQILAALFLLSSCAERLGPEALQPVTGPITHGATARIYVATSRERADDAEFSFTSGRADRLGYAMFTFAIPPGRTPGTIKSENPGDDPAHGFAVVERKSLDEAGFRNALRQEMRRGGGEIGVFVHGYNTSFQEALFRLAQLEAGSGDNAVPVLFAWPSEASLTHYLADRDAAAFSRDHLSRLLVLVSRLPEVRRLSLAAHSMGGLLAMESLRQLRLEGRSSVLENLRVVLAAPDVDLDLFRTQLSTIGPLSPPLTVLVSSDDRALSVSRRLTGGRDRVGNLGVVDPRVQEIAKNGGIRVLDITSISSPDALNHNRFLAFAGAYSQDPSKKRFWFREVGAFILDAAGNVAAAPFNIAGRVVSGE